ncbi:hypothetical protein BGX38DRAFT_1141024 [Terfezia claveryi]|nr:hypothetical protein BGX38DRAFT_1141024 [Terfezia claveryi]
MKGHSLDAIRRHPELRHWAEIIATRAHPKQVEIEWHSITKTITGTVSRVDQGDSASIGLSQLVMESGLENSTITIKSGPESINATWRSTHHKPGTDADANVDDGYIGVIGCMGEKETAQTIQVMVEAQETLEATWGYRLPKEKLTTVLLIGQIHVNQLGPDRKSPLSKD